MRSFYAKGLLLAIGALSAVGIGSQVQAQYPTYGSPSMLPPQQAAPMAQPPPPMAPPSGYAGYNYPSTGYQSAGYQPPANAYGGNQYPGNQYPGNQPAANAYGGNSYGGNPYTAGPPAGNPYNGNNYQAATYSPNRNANNYQTNPGFYSVSNANQGGPEMVPAPTPIPQDYGNGGANPMQGPLMSAMQAPWDAQGIANGTCGGSCGSCCYIPSFPYACGFWYGGVGGMVMGRDHANNKWLGCDNDNPTAHYLNSNDAATKVGAGAVATFGRYFNCGWNAIEASYWGAFPGSNSACAYDANTQTGLSTALPFTNPTCGCALNYIDGNGNAQTVQSAYDSKIQRVTNEDSFQNVEINVLGFGIGGFRGGCGGGGGGGFGGGSGGGGGGCGNGNCGSGGCGASACAGCCSWGPGGPGFCCGGCNCVRFAWLGGVRYLQFGNNFAYDTNPFAATFTGSDDEVHYRINMTNNLIGYQTGGRIDVCLCKCVSAYAMTKVGLFANNMSEHQYICSNQGYATNYAGQDFNFCSSATRASLLGEVDLGILWRFTRCWSANIGVRAVGVSGVGLTTNQIPTDFTNMAACQHINSNGNLILTGGYATVNYNW